MTVRYIAHFNSGTKLIVPTYPNYFDLDNIVLHGVKAMMRRVRTSRTYKTQTEQGFYVQKIVDNNGKIYRIAKEDR